MQRAWNYLPKVTQVWAYAWQFKPNSFWLQSPTLHNYSSLFLTGRLTFYEGYYKHKISQAQNDMINATGFKEIGFTDFKIIAQRNQPNVNHT